MHSPIIWSPGVTLQGVIRQTVQKAMTFYHGNKSMVANALGITVKTLDSKLSQYATEDEHTQEFLEYEARRKQFLLLRARGIDPGQAERDFFDGPNGSSFSPRVEKKPFVGHTPSDTMPLQGDENVSRMLQAGDTQSGGPKRGRPIKQANG